MNFDPIRFITGSSCCYGKKQSSQAHLHGNVNLVPWFPMPSDQSFPVAMKPVITVRVFFCVTLPCVTAMLPKQRISESGILGIWTWSQGDWFPFT